jgi:hypothetical protein
MDYYLLFGIVGNAIGTIGSGLLATFLSNTKTGAWVGYQILTGFRGMTFQIVSFFFPKLPHLVNTSSARRSSAKPPPKRIHSNRQLDASLHAKLQQNNLSSPSQIPFSNKRFPHS